MKDSVKQRYEHIQRWVEYLNKMEIKEVNNNNKKTKQNGNK